MKKIILPLILLLSFACGQKNNNNQTEKSLYSVKIKYAQGFKIDCFENYKRITIKNPWQKGATQQILYLVDNKNISIPNSGMKIVVPVTKIAVGSTTYYGFLDLLGEINSVKGACSANLAYNATIRQNIENKQIRDLGDAFSPNIEQIMMLQPQIFI